MEDQDLVGPTRGDRLLERLRGEGQRLFATLSRANRDTKDDLLKTRQAGERLARASVEGLELVEDTVNGLHESLDAAVREALGAALTAAWETLRHVGIEVDGTAPEAVDPARHRVIKSSAPPGRLPNRVTAVWRRGVTFKGQRVRAAEVTADFVEGLE